MAKLTEPFAIKVHEQAPEMLLHHNGVSFVFGEIKEESHLWNLVEDKLSLDFIVTQLNYTQLDHLQKIIALEIEDKYSEELRNDTHQLSQHLKAS